MPEPTKTGRASVVMSSVIGTFTEDTRAGAVTALDEVADSAWFTNRNAVRPLSPEQIRRGPGLHPAPRDGQTWAVVGMKQDGVAVGVRARDEAGDLFFLKFDPRSHDEVETGADVVVQRLLFAAGYNVSENDVVYVTRGDFTLAPDNKAPGLRDSDLDSLLTRAAREPDGRYRMLASRVISGKPIGGITPSGTRDDDANDLVRHEDRRDMRGLYSLAAWLDQVDMTPANTIEAWVPDQRDRSRGHVVHYLLDFGKALGAMGRIDNRLSAGFAHSEEAVVQVAKQVTLGAIGEHLPWEDLGPFPALRGLGWIESAKFDPLGWKPFHHWLPFEKADRFDRLWGARIVASFTRAQIRAAIDAARYSDPRTIAYLERVLVERQRKTLERSFADVAPLQQFAIRSGALCFTDLWVRHTLGGAPPLYSLRVRDQAVARHANATQDGTVCFEVLPSEVPSVVDIHVTRFGQVIPGTRVHLELRDGATAVAAIERQ